MSFLSEGEIGAEDQGLETSPVRVRIARMKALTQLELRTLVADHLSSLQGAQLQEVRCYERGLALGLWRGGSLWLMVDLFPNAPVALVFADEPPLGKSGVMKPVGLFLRSHARGRRLEAVELLEDRGRVVNFIFGEGEDRCELEAQLVPRQANLRVACAGKEIFWRKPRELGPAPALPAVLAEPRTADEICSQWLATLKAPQAAKMNPEEEWRRRKDRDLEKKRKALAEIERTLGADEAVLWAERGERIKVGEDFIDSEKSLAWNIETAFQKAKQAAAKKQGTLLRRDILHDEIARLEVAKFQPSAPTEKSTRVDLMGQAGAKGRKLALPDGMIAWIGKSAADNLALLRKARGWDLWLHLRDYPGAHAVIQRNREQNLSAEDRQRVARWLAEESVGSGKNWGRLEVVMAECRFVRPIKGDKLGRVTYQNEVHFFVLDGGPAS